MFTRKNNQSKKVTKDDVLRYVYHETDKSESAGIEQAMTGDTELSALFYEAASMKKDLDQAMMKPGRRVIDNILDYSKKHQHPEGSFESLNAY